MRYDLIGVGIGPFNLSLAALLEKAKNIQSLFFDKKHHFSWHAELMFHDSVMQTPFLTDLVTPVDPTHPHSFLNYLCCEKMFYHFLNTERMSISRMEFERYCQWVSEQLAHKLHFGTAVDAVSFKNGYFSVETSKGCYQANNICMATGLQPRIPECAKPWLGEHVFYVQSPHLASLQLTGKTVTIIGGGQTGIEIFSNALEGKWGNPKAIRMITARNNLESFDASPFTSEYFTPAYLEIFLKLSQSTKDRLIAEQHLLGNGSTPSYLFKLYQELYHKRFIEKDPREMTILVNRQLKTIEKIGETYRLKVRNTLHACEEVMDSDIVILCTGSQCQIPACLDPLLPRIRLDGDGRFYFDHAYTIDWDGPQENAIYALNFSHHHHGIIDPQTNLMAWRSAVVVNHLTKQSMYHTDRMADNFISYNRYVSP